LGSLVGQGKQLVLGKLGIENLSYANGNCDLSTIQFDVGYIQKTVALVGQDDMGNGIVLLIKLVRDEPIVSDSGWGSLSLISDSLLLIL